MLARTIAELEFPRYAAFALLQIRYGCGFTFDNSLIDGLSSLMIWLRPLRAHPVPHYVGQAGGADQQR
jgi:hypothetical protein